MIKEFIIKNKSTAVGSLGVAVVYVLFITFTLVANVSVSENYGFIEYAFLVIAIAVIVLDVVDLIRIKNNQLKISFDEDKVSIATYWFSKKEYKYKLMKNVILEEKQITFIYDEKKKSIGYLSKSDLIRSMKILKDNCEE